MNSPSEDIVDYLFDQGVGTLNVEMFVGITPIEPDNCVVVRDSGGFDPEPHINYQRPTIQVLVRNKSYQAGYVKIKQIADILNGNIDIVKGGSRYVAVWQQGDILMLGTDDKNRMEFSVNFRIHRTGV